MTTRTSMLVLLALALGYASCEERHCSLEGYNLKPLTQSFWEVPLNTSTCNNQTACSLLFSVCAPPTQIYCPKDANLCKMQHGLGVQMGTDAKIEGKASGDGFVLTYEFSYSANNKTLKNLTTIEFACKADHKFQLDASTRVGRFETRGITDTANGHHVVIDCDIGCKQRGSLGVGSQLMIALSVLFLCYFCGGMLYNHVNGARGEELIPHHWFWKNLHIYVVDGCIFVFRVVTCQARSNYAQNPDYGATSSAGVSPTGRTYETL